MDEWKAVPVEPTLAMLTKGSMRAYDTSAADFADVPMDAMISMMRPTYEAILAAAPTAHVAVKRELLERALKYISPSSSGHSDEVVRDLRNLLSQKGE